MELQLILVSMVVLDRFHIRRKRFLKRNIRTKKNFFIEHYLKTTADSSAEGTFTIQTIKDSS